MVEHKKDDETVVAVRAWFTLHMKYCCIHAVGEGNNKMGIIADAPRQKAIAAS
jgi:beta-galactosidase beta subunit